MLWYALNENRQGTIEKDKTFIITPHPIANQCILWTTSQQVKIQYNETLTINGMSLPTERPSDA